jgi:hypothetical protein
LRSFKRGTLISSNATMRAAKLSLTPAEEQDAQTHLFGELQATCGINAATGSLRRAGG